MDKKVFHDIINKFNKFIKKNKKGLLLLLGIVVLELFSFAAYRAFAPNVVLKLNNGNEVVAELEGKQVTANELYDKLKEDSGVSTLVRLVDNYIANKEIETKQSAIDAAQAEIDTLKLQYQQANKDFLADLANYGFNSELEYRDYLVMEDKKQQVATNYLEVEVAKDTAAITKYYNAEVFGAITTRHILIKPEVTTSMTDAQKATAEAAALKQANDLITQLNNGAKFEDLAKQYSDDTGTATNGGLFANFTKAQVQPEFWAASAALKDGEYTKTPAKTIFGYHIILRVSQAERPTLESAKLDIVDALITNMKKDDTYLIAKTLIKVREDKYGFKIYETVLKDLYNINSTNIKNQ